MSDESPIRKVVVADCGRHVTLSKGDESFFLEETVGFMPWNHLQWLRQIASTVTSWTELGVYCGRSALAVGLCLPPGGLLQLVDIEFPPRFYPNLAWLLDRRPTLKVTLCQNTTVEAAKILPDTDVVFVDDDHEYGSVRASLLAWRHKYKILCGHDYDRNEEPFPGHVGVKKAVDELCVSECPIKDDKEFNSLWVKTGEVKNG